MSQVVCASGNELRLHLSMTMVGIEGSLRPCLMLDLEHVLKPTLLSLGKNPCRTPATTTSGRSAGREIQKLSFYLQDIPSTVCYLTRSFLSNAVRFIRRVESMSGVSLTVIFLFDKPSPKIMTKIKTMEQAILPLTQRQVR